MNIKDFKILKSKDRFQFSCSCCGNCCRNREDILLSTYDIIRICKELNISVKQLIDKYGELYIGHTSKLPLIRLKPQGIYRSCPFLFNNKCLIQKCKPSVCALYPLGRVVEQGKEKVQYFLQDTHCQPNTQTFTLNEWLDKSIELESEKCFICWTKLTGTLSEFSREVVKQSSKETKEQLYTLMCDIMYGEYDADSDYVKQIEKRYKSALDFVGEAKKLLEDMELV